MKFNFFLIPSALKFVQSKKLVCHSICFVNIRLFFSFVRHNTTSRFHLWPAVNVNCTNVSFPSEHIESQFVAEKFAKRHRQWAKNVISIKWCIRKSKNNATCLAILKYELPRANKLQTVLQANGFLRLQSTNTSCKLRNRSDATRETTNSYHNYWHVRFVCKLLLQIRFTFYDKYYWK